MSDDREDRVRSTQVRVQVDKPGSERDAQLLSTSSQNWQRALFLPLTILAWLVIAIIVLWLLGHITHSLVVIILAVIVTFAVAPLVRLLQRHLTRPVAIAIAYLFGM